MLETLPGIKDAFYSSGIKAMITIMLGWLPSASLKSINSNKMDLVYSHCLSFLFLNCCHGFLDCFFSVLDKVFTY